MNTSVEAARVANPFSTAPVVAAPTGAAAHALAAREATHIQVAMMLARGNRRDPIAASDRLLIACTRQGLAEEAMYEYARGGTKITGPSIRLAEEAARCWGNLLCGVAEMSRSEGYSEWRAYAWDLETLFADEKTFRVRHWRDTKQGGYALTDERDIYELGANQGARRKRACILACIPGDVIEAAVKQCEQTLHANVDITAERIQLMLETFGEFNITQAMIEKRLQRRIETITPAGMLSLRRIYNSLRDGMGKPADYFEITPPESASADATPATASQTERAKEALRSRRREKGKRPDTGAQVAAADQAPAAATASEQPEGGKAQGSIPFFDTPAALDALKAAGNLQALLETWKHIFRDFRDSRRALPNSVAMRAIRCCTQAEMLSSVWKQIVSDFRDADIAMPIEVEATYHEQTEVLDQRAAE